MIERIWTMDSIGLLALIQQEGKLEELAKSLQIPSVLRL